MQEQTCVWEQSKHEINLSMRAVLPTRCSIDHCCMLLLFPGSNHLGPSLLAPGGKVQNPHVRHDDLNSQKRIRFSAFLVNGSPFASPLNLAHLIWFGDDKPVSMPKTHRSHATLKKQPILTCCNSAVTASRRPPSLAFS